MKAQRAKQFFALARRANGMIHLCVKDVPALPRAYGDGGYLDFFLKVVDEDIESSVRDLLDSMLTCIFSNLHCLDPTFDLSRTMEPVPAELRSPLRDEVHEHEESLVRKFVQAAPSEESGSLGDADDWIRTIEDLLGLAKCTDDRENVLYASHCLGGTIRDWWDGFQIMQGTQVTTWAVFSEGFLAAYIPPGMMIIKKREFRELKEGSGIVKEYLQKFNLLSR
ncbi:hypothetical protein D1007_41435 [Hordeum vulgare]|nr:hypothetical protein D1007_41435 [Hordeum vulgare]